MSRPAEAVNRVIKAYDVRGLVGDEIDERFVFDVGGAFARLVRSEGATACGASATTCAPVRRRWPRRSPTA